MARTLAVLLLALTACGPSSNPPRAPGWYGVPDEPAGRSWGTVYPSWVTTSRLEGTVSLGEGVSSTPLYLAVLWQNTSAPVVLTAPFEERFAVDVDPPAAARESSTCGRQRARGLLLVYRPAGSTPDPATDSLVSVSEKSRDSFSSLQTIYSQAFAWDECATPRPLVPLLLQDDPRLALALCAPSCAVPMFERTHVVRAGVDLREDDTSFQYEVLGKWPEVRVEVNGVVVPKDPMIDPPWVEGLNTVRITAGDLPAWTAEVVLPARALGVKLTESALRLDAPFTLAWSAPWATATRVHLSPLDVPIMKVADPSFYSKAQSLTEVFPGFRDSRGELREVPRAQLMVHAELSGPFSLGVTESIVAPVE